MIVRLRNFNPSNPCLGEMCMGFKARKWCVRSALSRRRLICPVPAAPVAAVRRDGSYIAA
jgi:hypothetical protein